ncbi:Zinc metalloproteinase/disintegrin [Plakobranchus ocellatus]|uniref:Zinc metalloproteinase/disintegrin n=1 Tax=Plakobranchus ocellatus TaxID=259542 RepID=A0AAV4DPM2_9GAST|nr:Zinc metalloproteinase/disintegrin [Plakobranchus ocellatus]
MARSEVLQLIVFLAFASDRVFGFVLQNDARAIKQVSGRMYFITPESGTQERLSRRHVEGAEAVTPRAVRLELGSEGINLDMTLTQGSVWTEDSRAFERRDAETVEVPLALDASCFMAGDVSSGEGSASFSHCGGLSGYVQTPEMEYIVEQTGEPDSEDDFSEVTVSLVPPSNEPLALDEEDDLKAQEEEERKYFGSNHGDENESYNSTERTKRCANNNNPQPNPQPNPPSQGADITAEVAVYADKYYADFLRSQGKNNLAKATTFFVNKWNTIARVYGDKKKVGLKFVIQLKHVEVWWSNPAFYRSVQADPNLNKHLNVFCSKTTGNKADHRMLYTVGVGGGTMGLAWIGGVCNPIRACSIVKSKTSNVRVELHEFGHSMGFKHEPQMEPCDNPDGFMGWRVTYKFSNCYRRYLLQSYNQRNLLLICRVPDMVRAAGYPTHAWSAVSFRDQRHGREPVTDIQAVPLRNQPCLLRTLSRGFSLTAAVCCWPAVAFSTNGRQIHTEINITIPQRRELNTNSSISSISEQNPCPVLVCISQRKYVWIQPW